MDKLFAERYGYIKPTEVLIVGCMPQEVINAICNCLFRLQEKISNQYDTIRLVCWTDFFNQKQSMYDKYNDCLTKYLEDKRVEWFNKLNLLDYFINLLIIVPYKEEANQFIYEINYSFSRLNYGYRVLNNHITPITDNVEIESIEEAIKNSDENIKEHLCQALKHLSDRDSPDYRNSIKESISAVGVLCREITGDNDLGKSLYVLEKKQNKLHPLLKKSFDTLYHYTNDKKSGIRHELMDSTGVYVPTLNEAKFMLVSCTALINYMREKFL